MATTTPVGGSEQLYLVTVVIDGTSYGIFDTFSGGDAEAPSIQHRGGGQKNRTSYASLVNFSQITVSRVVEFTRDWEATRQLKAKAGRVTGSVTIQPLDATMHAYGSPQVATGQFRAIKGVKGDSESQSESTFELTFDVDSWA